MRLLRGPVPIDVARELVEEALDVASRSADPKLRSVFQDELEAVQSIETVDIRENHFEALDSQWIERFRVAESLESVLSSRPGVAKRVSTCFLTLARNQEDERALLSEEDTEDSSTVGKPALVVRLTVDTFLAVDKLERLLGAAVGQRSDL